MTVNIRYRLIQILEIILWLGAFAGLVLLGMRLWAMQGQGWRAMLNMAAPGLLGIGAGMAVLIVLIGIYHNTRRHADALDRLARQGAGSVRRLQGVSRAEQGAAPQVQPVKLQPDPVMPQYMAPQPAAAPAPVTAPSVTQVADAASSQASQRRLGPAV
ncbi:hypothetical protein [Paracoccus sp. SCSIO 75233]|uniref:hypothetical protein n=1 Tax=Paracoccus sp. SCSIO 75233 TaxID=3017782 RepID=UPI0022EFF0F2|nr:hypothetical protein [Paracoccus sp. SCSIO 75233]WBU53865.1 hypothetical protein PAF12_03225 [Paracoccus sp. SCSIO 75233]